jgi:hypothetical protein
MDAKTIPAGNPRKNVVLLITCTVHNLTGNADDVGGSADVGKDWSDIVFSYQKRWIPFVL